MKNNKGQSLIEALVALTAAAIVVTAIAIALISSVNNSDFSKNQNLATQYSQQGMELLKQKSQTDWLSFSALSGTYCLADNSTSLTVPPGSGCGKNIDNFFVRNIVINQNNLSCSGSAKVTVATYWADGKCTNPANVYCHSVLLDSCLANINSTTSP